MASYESAWISFLRQYGPVSTNENMFDEDIQKAARNKKMRAVSFDAEHLNDLIDNFRSTNPVSVILTGTAGDGKTFYCRRIWEALGGDSTIWAQKNKISTLFLPNQQQHLIVIKDLSELNLTDAQQVLPRVAESITNQNPAFVYLIAANDGQLMEKWKEIPSTPLIDTVRRIIEDLLVNEQREKENVALRLYNLSHLPIKNLFPRVLNAVVQHEGWQTCEQCPFHEPTNRTKRCPIWENKQRLEHDEITRNRLLQLLELCEFNNIHLPIRQLLLLVSNMLLGHPEVKERLMSCRDIPQIIDKDTTAQGNMYRNAFGENLGKRRQQATDVFVALNRFGIGNETNSRIDNMLIFGIDDPSQKDYYQRFVLSDSYYGADNTYQSQQKAYLEGATTDDGEQFLSMLRTQRQRLFFTLPSDVEDNMNLWGLTVFQYAGDYLKIIEQLSQTDPITSKNTLAPLVRGLNRIFTGLLVYKMDKLILATSGSYSQARVCHILEEYVSVSRDKGQMVNLTRDANQHPLLQVSLGKGDRMKVALRLQLTRFEFLRRVAEGALPSSFSRECYEDILSFKTSLLRQLDMRRRSDEDDTELELTLNMIYLDNDGDIKDTSLEIQFS
jgi:hypothetical protein